MSDFHFSADETVALTFCTLFVSIGAVLVTWIVCAYLLAAPPDMRSNFVTSCAPYMERQAIEDFNTQRARCAELASKIDWSKR